MIHGNTVTNSDDAEINRCPAFHVNPSLYSFHDFVQMNMAWNNGIG